MPGGHVLQWPRIRPALPSKENQSERSTRKIASTRRLAPSGESGEGAEAELSGCFVARARCEAGEGVRFALRRLRVGVVVGGCGCTRTPSQDSGAMSFAARALGLPDRRLSLC
jgi:hypothetical protein